MHNKIPYYMAYPEFFMYGTERTDRMDYDYMKSTYPDLSLIHISEPTRPY